MWTSWDLTTTDRAILHMIIDKFSGGPVGLETLAAALGMRMLVHWKMCMNRIF